MRKIMLFVTGIAFLCCVNCLGLQAEGNNVKFQLEINEKIMSNMDAAIISGNTDLMQEEDTEYVKSKTDQNGNVNFTSKWNDMILIAGNENQVGAIRLDLTNKFIEQTSLVNQKQSLTLESGEGLRPKYQTQCRCLRKVWNFRYMCCDGIWGRWECFWVWHTTCDKK